ncbi:MAG: O-antigen/teichoic acid export membrane protein [Crocinitomicaceae bacterium]|jgi:O-antigen/teichoic acid export membrane protein
MIQSVFSVLAFVMVLTSGVFFYYYQWEKPKFQKMVFSSWFYYQLVCVIIIASTLYLGADYFKSYFIITESNEDEIKTAIGLTGLLFIPYIFNNTNLTYYRIDRKAKSAVSIVFIEAIFMSTIVIVGLHYYDFGIVEVILGQVVARSIVAILFMKTAKNYINIMYFSWKVFKRIFLFSWPFIIISTFLWISMYIDKFLGVDYLPKEDISLLALATQLSLPIVVLADMIRMAIAPFIMSIMKDKDAKQSYQQVFDLSVFSALIVLIGIIVGTPILTMLMGDSAFDPIIKVIPFIGLASIFSLVANQFMISFSLAKKNVYVMLPVIISGALVVLINVLFMKEYGFVVSGISQVVSAFILAVILFIYGKRLTDLSIKLGRSALLLLVIFGFIGLVYFDMEAILKGNLIVLIIGGVCSAILLSAIYFITYKKSKLQVD